MKTLWPCELFLVCFLSLGHFYAERWEEMEESKRRPMALVVLVFVLLMISFWYFIILMCVCVCVCMCVVYVCVWAC